VTTLDRPLDVSVLAIKNLLIDAYSRYDKAFREGDPDQRYWDGYIRALHHVIEMEDE
jgi:hypothetical protein